MSFREYAEHGWALCRLNEGQKGPRYANWNKRERAIPAVQAEHLAGAGLMHAYSGTCALDIDNVELSRDYLAREGIDLDAILQAPDSVGISSGSENRAKLLFSLPEPLPTKKVLSNQLVTLFELRCADAAGASTVQDVLPPSRHPTGRRYEWAYGSPDGHWSRLPPLPEPLRALWQRLLGPQASPPVERPASSAAAPAGDAERAQRILDQHDPDCDYDTWLRLGMALHNDLGEAGFELWDAWSSKGQKYQGRSDLDSHWNSFGRSPNPITLGSFLRQMVASRDDFDDLTVADPDEENPFDALAAEHKASSALKLWTLEEIQQRPWPEWLVLDILPRAEINMLYGESGVGKSALTLDMALAIASGKPWFGHDVEQGTVVWLAAEAFGSMKPRTRAYAMHNGVEWHTLAQLPFHVVESFNLGDQAQVTNLIEAAAPLKPKLVVVDTLAAATGGANENSGEDMGAILDACRAIYHGTGASVLLIHHSGKNQELGARGWSGIKAAVQAELKVHFDEGSSQRIFTSTKQRDGESGIAYGFSLKPVLVGEDSKQRPVHSVAIAFNGRVEPAQPPQGDGQGRKPPKGAEARAMLAIAQEQLGVGGSIESNDLLGAYILTLAPPAEGQRDERRKLATRVLNKLVAEGYLAQHAGRVSLPTDPDGDDGSDLI